MVKMQITGSATVFFLGGRGNQKLELIFSFFVFDFIFIIDENVKTKNTVFKPNFENRATPKPGVYITHKLFLCTQWKMEDIVHDM